MLDIVHGKVSPEKRHAVDEFIKHIKKLDKDHSGRFSSDDLLFTGYPLLDSPEGYLNLDALLLSKACGLVAFDFVCGEEKILIKGAVDRQDFVYNQLYSEVSAFKELMERRELAFKIYVISIDYFNLMSVDEGGEDADDLLICRSYEDLKNTINSLRKDEIGDQVFTNLKSVLQRMYRLKPIKKRAKVKKDNSKGNIMKAIEKQVANLDIYQNKAIVETNEGPQRITGLAGTGKTIVLAAKVAYLHALDPELEIAITFYSRALYQQYRELIFRLYFNQTREEPNWDKIHLLHAWGGQVRGMYSHIAKENGIEVVSYGVAVSKYGQENAFEKICDDLLKQLKKSELLFDVILIDEAQDMPRSFFEICYLSTKDPRRVIWAYDELQQVDKIAPVPPPEVLFGSNSDGTPRYTFKESEEGPQDDIVLKVCYRNPKEIITTAHALGLGVYLPSGPIQMNEFKDIWDRIGYDVEGNLEPNEEVTIKRQQAASPAFLKEYLQEPEIVNCHAFENDQEQADWIVEQIRKNITEDELEHTDILVIYPDAYTLKSETAILRSALTAQGIKNHVAGGFDASEYFVENSIAISHIHRAKGNEAPMIYLMNAEMCYRGSELILKRNILFTAITRARAWVRICGIGKRMEGLMEEVEKVKKNSYQLKFTFPSDLEHRRQLHSELSEKERSQKRKHLTKLSELSLAIEKGEIDPEDISEEELSKLKNLLFKGDS